MNWEAVSAVAEIIGLAVLIATVAYLAIQVRDSNKIARADSLQSILDGQRDRSIIPWIVNPEIADVFAAGLNSFESLSASDQRRCYLAVLDMILQMQNVLQLREKGLITEVEYRAWIAFSASLVVTPGGNHIWGLLKKQLTPTVANAIDEYISANPDAPSFSDINPLFRTGD